MNLGFKLIQSIHIGDHGAMMIGFFEYQVATLFISKTLKYLRRNCPVDLLWCVRFSIINALRVILSKIYIVKEPSSILVPIENISSLFSRSRISDQGHASYCLFYKFNNFLYRHCILFRNSEWISLYIEGFF